MDIGHVTTGVVKTARFYNWLTVARRPVNRYLFTYLCGAIQRLNM